MKNLIFILFIGWTVLFLTSCQNSTTPAKPKPAAVTSLKATSADSTTIELIWTASTSETDTLFSGYIVSVSPSPLAPMHVAKGVNVVKFTGLTEGTIYTLSVQAVMDSVNSDAASVVWSPASRFDKNIDGDPIRVYETVSPSGSGLDLYDETGEAPKVLTVNSSSKWNLAFDTRDAAHLIVGSPNSVNYSYKGGTPPVTQISSDYDNLDFLNDYVDSVALNIDESKFQERTIDLSQMPNTKGIVLVLRTKEGSNTDWTYAKVIIRNLNKTWLEGNAPNRYFNCSVSYQKKAGVPYAKRRIK